MIRINQFLLVFKRMIQHFALCGMLDVEKVVHEVVRTCVGVSTFEKLFQLLFCEFLTTVWCLDQHRFGCSSHSQLVIQIDLDCGSICGCVGATEFAFLCCESTKIYCPFRSRVEFPVCGRKRKVHI